MNAAASLEFAASLDSHQKPGRGHSKSTSNFHNVDQTHVALAAFDSADVRPVKVSSLSQPLLRQALPQPLLSDRLAELDTGIDCHALMLGQQRL